MTSPSNQSLSARYEQTFAENEQAKVALQDKKAQIEFLRGALHTETRNNFAPYMGDSEYLKSVMGEAQGTTQKMTLVSAELQRVERELPECEKAAQAARVRLHSAEVRWAEVRNAEWRIPAPAKQLVDPAVTEVLTLKTECAQLKAIIATITDRIDLYQTAARMFRGEGMVRVESPTVDRFVFGPESREEKSAKLTDEVVTKLRPELSRAQERLAGHEKRIAQLRVQIAKQIHPILIEWQRKMFALADQVEVISGELDEMITCRGVDLPLGRANDRHVWGGLNYFRDLGCGHGSGTSEYRAERMGRIETGVLDAEKLQRRAS